MHYRKPVIKTHGGAKEHEELFSLSKTQRRCRALAFALALMPLSASALAPTSIQGNTLKELIDVIEDRHYASRRYDDALSAQHFVAYLDALDPQRMFLTRQISPSFPHGSWNWITLAGEAIWTPPLPCSIATMKS